VADRHPPTSLPRGNSSSDETSGARPRVGVDGARPLDSDTKGIPTNVPERLDLLLPGEAALVYQYLRDRLETVFDHVGD
jgi:hypothetical protein